MKTEIELTDKQKQAIIRLQQGAIAREDYRLKKYLLDGKRISRNLLIWLLKNGFIDVTDRRPDINIWSITELGKSITL